VTATLDGNRKIAAGRIGVAVDEYQAHVDAGEQWCTGCRAWHPLERFARDATRLNGLARRCRDARQAQPSVPDPVKRRARDRVHNEVRLGRFPRADDLPCIDCGHEVGRDSDDGRRHEYDHHHGYDDEHALDVIVLCTPCHGARERARRKPELLAAVVDAYLETKTR